MDSAESRRFVSGAETVTARPLIISNFTAREVTAAKAAR